MTAVEVADACARRGTLCASIARGESARNGAGWCV